VPVPVSAARPPIHQANPMIAEKVQADGTGHLRMPFRFCPSLWNGHAGKPSQAAFAGSRRLVRPNPLKAAPAIGSPIGK
jgi:hypothetical protein